MPDKDARAEHGYHRVEGRVLGVSEQSITVRFDEPFAVHSQSGSPFISQRTGKVIGVFSGSGPAPGGGMWVMLAPAASIAAAMARATERPALKSTIGRSTPSR